MSNRRGLHGMTAAALPNDQRLAVRDRQRGKCFYCWQKIYGWTFVLDHLVPRSAGGPDGSRNRVAAHPRCDGDKGGRLPTPDELQTQSAILESERIDLCQTSS